ncbi:hypothetical protein HK100_010131 [Physocladia obscura]|uniref:Uncharacterized protein n=1 Tax=Physocladia obscura TaxID=109957 RepID=A0AAD5XHQ0_9FUNG|nr:hypothetical protein HK100_010131 [Physocladia obscura]
MERLTFFKSGAGNASNDTGNAKANGNRNDRNDQNRGMTRLYWSESGSDIVNVIDVTADMESEDLRLAILAQLSVTSSLANCIVNLRVSRGAVAVPLSCKLPANSAAKEDRYIVAIVNASEVSAPTVVPAVPALPLVPPQDLTPVIENFHAEIDALKWQVRLMKKQLALGNNLSNGIVNSIPLGAFESGAKNLSDEEAQDLIHDVYE